MIFYKGVAFKRLLTHNRMLRNYCSALYIVGSKATDTCIVVNPWMDLESCLKNVGEIEQNIKRRKCNIKIDQFKELGDFFLTVNQIKKKLQERKTFIFDTIIKLEAKNDVEAIEKYKMQAQIVNEDFKSLKRALWSVEEDVMLQAFSLPNVLHPRTLESETIIETHRESSNKISSHNHLDIGTKLDLLTFTSPYNYYLKNDAALFELQAKFFFSDSLKKKGYIQFSNPDFVKSVIVEGCGTNHMNPDDVFILHHNENSPVKESRRLHLTGGSSLYAYAAYFMRNAVPKNKLPLRYYSFGRQYKPVPEKSPLGLFEVSQASAIEIFIATNSTASLDVELDKIVSDVTDIYKQIDYPFRMCYLKADQLHNWESLRVSFQMYSPFHKTYMEVGNVSVSDDYISKRLQITAEGQVGDYFLKIISGTVLSVPKLLGFALEFDTDTKLNKPTVFEDVF